MNILIVTLKVLLLAVFGVQPITADEGLATRFGDPGDKLMGGRMSCTHRKMTADQMVCAHRTLPCGTPVVVENLRTGKFAVCAVLDRGPFGAIVPSGRWRIKRDPSEPGIWRGLVDLSPSVARALSFNGREQVRLFYPTRAAEHQRPLPAPRKRHHRLKREPERLVSIS